MTEKQKKETTSKEKFLELAEELYLEKAWGEPSYSSGLDLFGKSHESVANNTKAKATAYVISSTSLEELLSEIDNNKKL